MTTYLDVYQQIKALEGVFQVPVPTVTVTVGTLDAATGTFSGKTTNTITDPEPIAHRPGERPVNPPPHYQGETWVSTTIDSKWRRTTTVTPAPKVGPAPVVLRFDVVNHGGQPLDVTIGGHTTSSKPGEHYVLYTMWDLTRVDWRASCGQRSYSDRLMIQRDPAPIIGVGAFTIPALPLSIIYAPPQDAAEHSVASYTQSRLVGTSSSVNLAAETTTTTPWLPTNLASLDTLRTILTGLSSALGQTGNAYAQAIGAACGVIAGGIGTMSGSHAVGTVDNYQRTVTVTVEQSTSIHAEASNGGPGAGDVLHYLRDAKIGWVLTGGALRLTLLGAVLACYPVGYLQEYASDTARLQLSRDTVEQLLALDPFVAGWAGMTLPTPRFVDVSAAIYGGPLEYGGGQTVSGSYSRTFATTTTRQEAKTSSYVQDFQAGWLARIFGSTTAKVVTQVSSSRAAGTTVSETQTFSWELHSGPDEHVVVEFWLDEVFGTLAMRQQLPEFTIDPRVRDIARDRRGRPLGRRPVVLTVGERSYRTVTDDEGHYAFHDAGIPSGAGYVEVEGQPIRPTFIGEPHGLAPRGLTPRGPVPPG